MLIGCLFPACSQLLTHQLTLEPLATSRMKVLCTPTTHAQSWKATICLVSGMASAAHMNMLMYVDMSAKNALRERGNTMRGISSPMAVILMAVSWMAEAEEYQVNTTLGGIITSILHIDALPVNSRPHNIGLEASIPTDFFILYGI